MQHYSTEVMAGRINKRRSVTTGEGYVRRKQKTEKQRMRDLIITELSLRHWPNALNVLTFPSIHWSFENDLINKRERPRDLQRGYVNATIITAIERETPIFRAAALRMPGTRDGEIHILETPPWASAAVRTRKIGRFYQTDFESLAAKQDYVYDAAWLDFNGPLSPKLVAHIISFWSRKIRWKMFVTVMHGRYTPDAMESIERYGSPEEWLSSSLTDSRQIMSERYRDNMTMIQMGFVKTFDLFDTTDLLKLLEG